MVLTTEGDPGAKQLPGGAHLLASIQGCVHHARFDRGDGMASVPTMHATIGFAMAGGMAPGGARWRQGQER